MHMKTYTLNYSCLIEASVQEVCAFHTDTRNLPLITPPSTKVSIVAMEVPLREKSVVVLDIKRFGVTTRWEMEIATLDCPHMITDSMLKGPFSAFRHERHFTPLSTHQTRMDETITLCFPLPLVDKLLFGWVKKDMDAMFAYRHAKTQAYFLEKSTQTNG